MNSRVVITRAAEQDIRHAVTWWRDHRSPEQAERWYNQNIQRSPHSLKTRIDAHSLLKRTCFPCRFVNYDLALAGERRIALCLR